MKKNKINTLVIIGISILTTQSYATEKLQLEKKNLSSDLTDSANNPISTDIVIHLSNKNKDMYLSADGKILVTNIFSRFKENEFPLWSENKGMTVESIRGLIPDADANLDNYIIGMSKDGSTLIGSSMALGTTNTPRRRYTFRWTPKTGAKHLNADTSSHVQAISDDGSVITGQIQINAQTSPAFIWTEKNGMHSLGTLKSNGLGLSFANGISADGSTVVGESQIDRGERKAFRWTKKTGMQGLGTLKPDNSGFSTASQASANGHVVIGESDTKSSTNDHQVRHAFRWTEATGMVDLGTLGTYSSARFISKDGSIIAGSTDINPPTDTAAQNPHRRDEQAFRWTEKTGMVSLGSLKRDNSGDSIVYDMTDTGSVIVGAAKNDQDKYNAYRWTENTGMVNLGTLASDNSGSSAAQAVSSDGLVIVGLADSDNGRHVALWKIKSEKNEPEVTIVDASDLSRAKNTPNVAVVDTSNSSRAENTPKVAVVDTNNSRRAQNTPNVAVVDTNNSRRAQNTPNVAVVDTNNSSRAQNTPKVAVVNANNSSRAQNTPKVAVVDTNNSSRAQNTPNVAVVDTSNSSRAQNTPKVAIVDASSSTKAMLRTASRGFAVLDFYQSILTNLSNSRCQLDEGNYCVGLLSQYNNLNNNHHAATGFYGALRLPVENWTTGAAFNFTHNTTLIDNYDTQGNNLPAISLFTRYQKNRNNDGLYADLSAAYLSQDIRITRDALVNTEPGEGNSTVIGYQARLGVGYGISVTHQTQLIPEMGLSYNKMDRRGYTENQHADFEAKYGRIENKRINLQLGLNIKHSVSEVLQLHGKIGTNTKLYSDRDAFTAHISYIGAYSYDSSAERTINPYVSAGLNVNATKNSILRSVIRWQQQNDYKYGSTNIGLSYSYNW
ncbi:autotransporter domain-containing protein [Providencia sp.]